MSTHTRILCPNRFRAVLFLALAALLTLGAGPLLASADPEPGVGARSESEAPSAAENGEGAVDPAQEYFTETVLVDQHGEPRRFYSDLLAGHVVVINAFFTSCNGVCPVMAGNLVRVQDWLGERLGDDVRLISISVDPERDTPEKLFAYADRFGARPGWSFLSGDPEKVDFVLRRLGQAVDEPENHTSIMVIGNLRTGLWKKAQGLASSAELIAIVDSVLKDEGEAHVGP